MTQLTQQHFDQNMEEIFITLKQITNEMITRDYLEIQLEKQSAELKYFSNESFEIQNEWTDERFGELLSLYDLSERMQKLETDFQALRQKAN